jgi:alpha-glucosidase
LIGLDKKVSMSLPWWRNSVINRRAFHWEAEHQLMGQGDWWNNAAIYQINPWSFLDTDADGIGDLAGIIHKLDYIVSLGVDAVWLSPFYPSPLKDMGYDICDMRGVAPRFGTLADFDRLLDLAHHFGLKVLIDQVWNHTSDQHPWFQESRQSRDNAKADWYVWSDPQPDGSPPNNWLSAFSGDSAWEWVEERQQYYLHNFLKAQPDLNWHNPDVVEALLDTGRFWLERGVDGLRLDAVNFYWHDPELKDNPCRDTECIPDGLHEGHPLANQLLKHNFQPPKDWEIIHKIRDLVDEYPGVVTLGEITLCEDSVALAGQYIQGRDRLHLTYHVGLHFDHPLTANCLEAVLKKVQVHYPNGGTCWIVGNHDYGRLKSRWCCEDGTPYPPDFYRMVAAMLLVLPGAFCLYQGDELGLTVADIPEEIPVEAMRDPFGKAFYPEFVGRDGSRTPMPWDQDQPFAGFTRGDSTWLPMPQEHVALAVEQQSWDPDSLLNVWRRLLHWRKQQPALKAGDFELQGATDAVLAFTRCYAEQKLLCVFNISEDPQEYHIPDDADCKGLRLGFPTDRDGNTVTLPAYGVFFGEIQIPTAYRHP